MENRIEELADSEEVIHDLQELERRREELREIIDDLEKAREGAPDADLDTMYLNLKEQRDELFQACVDLFQESSTALVLLITTENGSLLNRLETEDLTKLYKRLQVLKNQDSYGTLSLENLETAERAVLDRLEQTDKAATEDLDTEDTGFQNLGDLTVL